MSNAMTQLVKQATIAADETKKAEEQKVKRRTTRKPQQKKTEISAVVQAVASIPVKYVLAIRPTGGRQLKAYTRAWMELLGFLDGKEYPRKTLTAIAGERAIAYHTTTTCTIEQGDKGLKLSAFGAEGFFPIRDACELYDRADVDAYIEIMKSGKADGRLVKNPAIIKALSV